jgi:hypothetical protein
MSNSSTRVKYDPTQLSLFDKSNKDANVILLEPSVKESTSACYAEAGSINAASQMSRPMIGSKLSFGDLADIENRLTNRGYELNNEIGRTNQDYASNYGLSPKFCYDKDTQVNENSRYTNPVVDYREMYTAPYKFTPYLYISPQQVTANNDNFMTPNRYGESSRYASKSTKFELKPKEYASVNKPVEYNDLVKGLLPTVKKMDEAKKPYIN